MSSGTQARIAAGFLATARRFEALVDVAPAVAQAAEQLVRSLRSGAKIMFCGNGGSAADSQHLAAELVGRFAREREPLAAISLTVDSSAITAIGNDYGYDHVFERQLRGIGRAGDALVAISTSGQSANVVSAARAARQMGVAVVALTGRSGGALATLADVAISVPATRADSVQELHIAVGHMICDLVEERMMPVDGQAETALAR